MFGWFAPRCPLNTLDKVWVERRMQWLTRRFGIQRMRDARVILPTDEFFPDRYDCDEPSARICLDRMCKYLGVDSATIVLEVRSDDDMPGAAGLYQMNERSKICIARSQLENPTRLLATLAHELSHELLLKGGHITRETSDHEQATDLLPVVLGAGIFLANATVVHASTSDGPVNYFSISKHGYLSSITLGYALALFAFVRGENSPRWANYLRTDARVTLKKGLSFLRATRDTIYSPESVERGTAEPTAEEIQRDLCHRSPTFRLAALWDIAEHSFPPERLLPAVTACLKDRDLAVQCEAVRTLGAFGTAAIRSIPLLIEAAWYGQHDIRIAAIESLGVIGGDPGDIVPALATVLRDTEPEIVRTAALALARFGDSASRAEDELLQALEAAAALIDDHRIEALILALRNAGPNVQDRIRSHFAGRDREGMRIVLEHVRVQEKRNTSSNSP